MKLCVSFCLDIHVEAEDPDDAYLQAESILRPVIARMSAGRVDIQATHTGTTFSPEKDDVVGFPVFDESRGRHDPDV